MCVWWVALKLKMRQLLANCSISLSKMVFLAVFHQGFYPLVPSAGRGLSHSSQESRWVGGTQWVGVRRKIEDVGGMGLRGAREGCSE